MAYSLYTPILLHYTGLSVTAGAPTDVATIPLPATGLRWVFRQPVLYHLGPTGDIGSVNALYQIRSAPAGLGDVVASMTPLVEIGPTGAAILGSTVTGWIQATGITIRATANCTFSAPIGITVLAQSL